MSEIKYVLHPGYIRSKSDGDLHFIGVSQLLRLYDVKRSECIVWDVNFPERNGFSLNSPDYKHLYPKSNGDYYIPWKQ